MGSSRTGHKSRTGLVRRWAIGVRSDLVRGWPELAGLWHSWPGWVAHLAGSLGDAGAGQHARTGEGLIAGKLVRGDACGGGAMHAE